MIKPKCLPLFVDGYQKKKKINGLKARVALFVMTFEKRVTFASQRGYI